ncbi:hypothetical protein Pmani_035175 [Petrolisthes manimaculis]|uniref:Uncharacterized protein n=1 Tax=Petrolisthes manimaculis TaxID=1843537 RepID=A0AAE1NM88_9EUCA|nr:hypothetical protein Pmani_035175 [Petrolisthes manimaculis]
MLLLTEVLHSLTLPLVSLSTPPLPSTPSTFFRPLLLSSLHPLLLPSSSDLHFYLHSTLYSFHLPQTSTFICSTPSPSTPSTFHRPLLLSSLHPPLLPPSSDLHFYLLHSFTLHSFHLLQTSTFIFTPPSTPSTFFRPPLLSAPLLHPPLLPPSSDLHFYLHSTLHSFHLFQTTTSIYSTCYPRHTSPHNSLSTPHHSISSSFIKHNSTSHHNTPLHT